MAIIETRMAIVTAGYTKPIFFAMKAASSTTAVLAIVLRSTCVEGLSVFVTVGLSPPDSISSSSGDCGRDCLDTNMFGLTDLPRGLRRSVVEASLPAHETASRANRRSACIHN